MTFLRQASTRERGVVLYIQKKFCASSVSITTNFEEVVLCKFSLKNKDNLLVACIYRSPNSPRGKFCGTQNSIFKN